MRKVTLVLLTILIALVATGIASAQINRFEGQWRNINPGDEGITSIVITHRGARARVHVWGRCLPRDCDWGEATAYAYGDGVRHARRRNK
jgi:hypothetical protein